MSLGRVDDILPVMKSAGEFSIQKTVSRRSVLKHLEYKIAIPPHGTLIKAIKSGRVRSNSVLFLSRK